MVNSERGADAGVAAHPHGGGGHRSDEWRLSRARAESDDRSPVTGHRDPSLCHGGVPSSNITKRQTTNYWGCILWETVYTSKRNSCKDSSQ